MVLWTWPENMLRGRSLAVSIFDGDPRLGETYALASISMSNLRKCTLFHLTALANINVTIQLALRGSVFKCLSTRHRLNQLWILEHSLHSLDALSLRQLVMDVCRISWRFAKVSLKIGCWSMLRGEHFWRLVKQLLILMSLMHVWVLVQWRISCLLELIGVLRQSRLMKSLRKVNWLLPNWLDWLR